MQSRPTIFFSALERSADRHAGELIGALHKRSPEIRCVGIAGPAMQAAGCEALYDLTSKSAMLAGAFGLVGTAGRMLCDLDRRFAAGIADLFVPVDSPTFNLPLSHRAKARGMGVAYYIAPQVWAWAEYRVNKVRRRTDKLMVILPFEEEYFRGYQIDATFVGHPLIESLNRQSADESAICVLRQGGSPVIACLAGSRHHVVDEVLPGQIEVCRKIAAHYPNASFLFAAASEELATKIRSRLSSSAPALRSRIERGRNAEVIRAADLVLVASGTATLEVAYHRRPMVVMYNASRWGYELVAKHLIRTPHLCLVNILAGRRLVPEFMPYYLSTEPIAVAALELLNSEAKRAEMAAGLNQLITSLGSRSAADEAASILIHMLESRKKPSPGLRGSSHRIW